MSLTLKKPLPYSPGKILTPTPLNKRSFDILKQFVHLAVDKVAPGLGKKEKAATVHNIATIVHKLGSYTKKAVVNATKHVIGDPASFLSFNHLPQFPNMSYRSKGRSPGVSNEYFSKGGYALGGVTKAPVSVSHNIKKQSKPKIRIVGDATEITHSEMLGAVVSGAPIAGVTAYRCTGYRSNPGMASIFPWLSTMAVNFEKYRFRRLTFTLVPLVSTSFSGRIGIGFDYDSSDAVPGSRQEFYALTTHSENMPWEACSVAVKCDAAFRFTGTHVAADNKLIDLGQVVVLSDSVSNGAAITTAIPLFDLIVDYTVELKEPQQALFSTQLFSNTNSLIAGVPLATGPDLTTSYGPTVVIGTSVTTTVVTLSLPAGNYMVTNHSFWSSGTITSITTAVTSGAGMKNNSTVNNADFIGTAMVSSPVEFNLTYTAVGVLWTANLFRFMVGVTRVPSQVYNGYFN